MFTDAKESFSKDEIFGVSIEFNEVKVDVEVVEDVIAVADDIGVRFVVLTAVEVVAAVLAIEAITATATDEDVVSVAAVEGVRAGQAKQDVVFLVPNKVGVFCSGELSGGIRVVVLIVETNDELRCELTITGEDGVAIIVGFFGINGSNDGREGLMSKEVF